jgi:hypothetical protein
MHLAQSMLDAAATEQATELPLDFTQFLSERLSLEPPATLAMLGTFLLNFEPTRPRPKQEPWTSELPPDQNSDYLEVKTWITESF